MSARKRGHLSDFTSVKPDAAPPDKPAATPPARQKRRKGQTLRLSSSAWRQLKLLALERESSAHALLIEAVNDLFRKYGKKPIA